MTIGLILSQTPAYSETFFNSKIKGLQAVGYNVILFVQSNPNNYNLCKVKTAPKLSSKPLKNIGVCLLVILGILLNFKRIWEFVKLEKHAKKTWRQVFINVFTNSHIFSTKLDWLHFGFTTLAIESEHVAKTIGAKMAVSLRGFDIDVYPLKHPDCYKLVWQQVDKVHVISNYLLQRAYQLGLSRSTEVHKITPAININKFNSEPKKMYNNKLQILTVARLHWIKALTEILEALALVKQNGIAFTYTLIGDGVAFQNLKFAVHQLGLSDDVFFKGKLPHQEVVELLSSSDIYIQYSHSEGFCNAVIEAQAMGCMCVVSDGGALPENVIDNKTGWIVPKRQPAILAQKILEVIHLKTEEIEKISDQAIKRVRDEFSLKLQRISFKRFYIEE